MTYKNSIETLVNQIDNKFKQEDYKNLSQYMTALLNALSSKAPDTLSAKAFIKVLNTTLFQLIAVGEIQTLQGFAWIDKALRLATSLALSQEQQQLGQIREKLRVKIEQNVNLGVANKSSQSPLLSTNTKDLNEKYRKYFDQMAKLLTGKPLTNPESADLVRSLKNIIFSDCQDGPYPRTKVLLEQTIELCRHNSLESDGKELAIIQEYLYPKDQVQGSLSANSTEEELLAAHKRAELENKALEILGESVGKEISDQLSNKLALQLLALKQPAAEMQKSSLELMEEIAQQFSLGKDIGLTYHYLEQAIRFAEDFDLSEQRNRLILAQGDLFAQEQEVAAAPKFSDVVESLKDYFDLYFNSQNFLKAEEIEAKISTWEIRVIYHEAIPWIMQQLMKSAGNLEQFKRVFASACQIGDRLIAYDLDLAWEFYAKMQSLLTHSTQQWHEVILAKLAEISRIRQEPRLNNYPQISDWKKNRSELVQSREELKETSKLFASRQKFYTKSVMRMIAGWLKEAEILLGPSPARFCLMGLGSISRGLFPYSDVEWLLLFSDDECAQWDNPQSEKARYFSALYRFLELRMVCLGELRGFRLDKEGHPRVEDRLRGTPRSVLVKNHPATVGVRYDDEMTYSILSPVYLYGDKDLEREFHQCKAELLQQAVSNKDSRTWQDALAVSYLPLHCKYYKDHDPFVKNTEPKPVNIKKDYIAPMLYAITDLCLHYRLGFTNTVDFINQLKNKGMISADFAEAILQGTELANEIRVDLHLHYGEQNDEAMPYGITKGKYRTLTADQQKSISLLAAGLLRPLGFILENLRQSKSDDIDNLLFNPLEAMIKQAVSSHNNNELERAVQSTLYALILAKSEVDRYRLTYLAIPKEARLVFQRQLVTLKNFLPPEKIELIRQNCLESPLPNGVRESQQAKEREFNKTLGCLLARTKQNQDRATIQWINSEGQAIQDNLHPNVLQYFKDKGYLNNGKLEVRGAEEYHQLSPKLYLKFFTETPGKDAVAYELVKLLTDFGAPLIQLARLEIGGQVIPVLISQAPVVNPLSLLIKELGEQPNQVVNARRYHQLVLLAVLLNHEDAKRFVREDENRLRQQVDPVVAAEILHFDAHGLLNQWLNQLEKIARVSVNTQAVVTLNEYSLANLYVELTQLQSYLKDHPAATLFDLLGYAEPKLQAKAATKSLPLKMARGELALTQGAYQIGQGSFAGLQAFSQLQDMRLRELIINKIDFEKLPLSDAMQPFEVELLNSLTKMATKFRSLKLLNCKITDEQLAILLQDSPELEVLVLDNCPLLTERVVMDIAKNCPRLEILKLTRLKLKIIDTQTVTMPQRLTANGGGRAAVIFPELHSLDVSECSELTRLHIAAPKVLNFKARFCLSLKTWKLENKAIFSPDLTGCSLLEELLKQEYSDLIEECLPQFRKGLTDPNEDLQRESVLVLRALGRNDLVVNQLKKLTTASLPGLCAAAAVSLSHSGITDQELQELKKALEKAFVANDKQLLIDAIPFLRRLGVETDAVCLTILFKDPSKRIFVLDALASWPLYSDKVIQALKQVISMDKNLECQAKAFLAYWKLETKYMKQPDQLLNWVQEKSNYFKDLMPKLLASITKLDSKTALEIRQNMAKIKMGGIATNIQHLIQQLKTEKNWQELVGLVQYIGENQIRDLELVKLLIASLQKGNVNVRVAAAKAIGYLEIKDSKIDDLLTTALDDNDGQVVAAVVKVISHRGINKLETQKKLMSIATNSEKDKEVRELALAALGTCEFSKELLEVVIKCLADKYIDIKCVAIKTLGQLLSSESKGLTLTKLFNSSSEPLTKRPSVIKTAPIVVQVSKKPFLEKTQHFNNKSNFLTTRSMDFQKEKQVICPVNTNAATAQQIEPPKPQRVLIRPSQKPEAGEQKRQVDAQRSAFLGQDRRVNTAPLANRNSNTFFIGQANTKNIHSPLRQSHEQREVTDMGKEVKSF